MTRQEGEFCNKRCPKCGATLLKNERGDEWCSFPGCEYLIWRIMKVNLLEKIKFKIMLFLMGFPEGIRGKIELDKKLNIWDKFRYWVIVNFY